MELDKEIKNYPPPIFRGRMRQIVVAAHPEYDKFCTLLTNIVTTSP